MYDIAIIGGGASGLAAACQTVGAVNKEGRPLSVIVIEKENRCGKKLLATGNGRCNLTNVDTDLSHYHGSVKEIAASVFEKTDDRVLQRFWQDLGIEYTQGDRGKLYPRSLQASSVLNALRRKMEKGGVIEKTGSRLTGLRRTKAGYYELSLLVEKKDPQEDKPGSGRTRGGKPSVKAVYEKEKLTAHTVLICMGGKASPQLGADGDGTRLARSLDMKVAPEYPAICRILIDSPYNKRLSGTKVTCPVTLWDQTDKAASAEGEVLFTDEGVSGPPILDLSRKTGQILRNRRKAFLTLDLCPEMNKGQLFAYFSQRFETLKDLSLEEALEGWLPKKMILPLLMTAGLDKSMVSGQMTGPLTGRLMDTVKAWTLTVSAIDSFKDAQVTVGGVTADQIGEDLMSPAWPGLFWCGEVLDLDGDCGGYNLRWATASGITAAQNAAAYLDTIGRPGKGAPRG
ncbi:MAG TPA: hypothetical protein DEP00_03595 [Lachnospiraceae bacterium]|nr:hypothetical protein [Lachnospiraceae bacterium]